MARVVLENADKVYPGGIVAASDVNLEIAAGEFMVLVGPSGCGKSTTLRMIAGLETITSGTVSIGDRVVNEVEPKDRNIAMVFQSYTLYPHMSVRDNMAFGLKLRKTRRTNSIRGWATRPTSSASPNCWTANPRPSPANSTSEWSSDEPSCATRTSFSSTSP